MLYLAVNYLTADHGVTDMPRFLLATLILLVALLFFRHKKRGAEKTLNKITE